MLLRVLISILLLAVYLPGAYGDDGDEVVYEGLYVDGEGYIGSNSTDGGVDYSDVSDSSSSNEISEANSSDIVEDAVATYIEEYDEIMSWDINALVDSFTDCLAGFPD